MDRRFALVVLASLLVAAPAGAQEPTPSKAGKAAGKKGKSPQVVVKTSMGSFTLELFQDKAPLSVANFLQYVDEKFYDGTVFHRVISDFMIQGGGHTADLGRKPVKEPVKNEATNGLKNTVGTVAMARTSAPDSATSQFFVNVKDNPFLDHRDTSAAGYGYTVFGKVVAGMDVVNKIKAVPTGMQGGMSDVPTTPVVIESIRRK